MSTTTVTDRVYNFSPGPAALPLPVLEQIQSEMLSLPGCGASILEISHRSKQFLAIRDAAKQRLRQLLRIGDEFEILFLQGGSRLQFSMVAMNLLRGSAVPAEYLITGSWSKSAHQEAVKEGPVRVTWDGKSENYRRLPRRDEWTIDPRAPYLYLTSNETIQGIQFQTDLDVGGVPVVCDASSDFLWRPIDMSRYGLLYACAQKNAGPAGVTIVVIRKDLLDRSRDDLPGYMNYKNHAAEDSLWNTPPTFAVYVVGLIAKWLLEDVGGLEQMAARNRDKAHRLYEVIDGSDGFYRGHAAPADRSMMNVTFRLPTEALEKEFVAEGARRQLDSLAGHRSVGGIRASIYNAMPIEGVEALRDFMLEFCRRRKGQG
ncbi:MAG: 3-phosphoserine/phosphohydroxythreonine transaminase [Pirellulaceae bacterium]